MITVQRIYTAAETDGYRVLVDRLWPRGVTKEEAGIDLWAKVICPSAELRRWYHDSLDDLWVEFQVRYRLELSGVAAIEQLDQLRAMAKSRPVVLLTANRNESQNHANVLRDVLVTGGG
jgi:uncharacterized protein YeaO (DUF488 family)